MMRRPMWTCALLFWLAASAACGQAPATDPQGPEVIYRMKLGPVFGRTIDVFNVEREWFARDDVSYLDTRDQQYGEFGSPIIFCSNREFYCIRGGIRVAVPKVTSGQARWSADGMECEAESPFTGERIVASCAFADATTRFSYAPENGIEWYERSGDEGHRYELVGPRGLFAAGTPSAEE